MASSGPMFAILHVLWIFVVDIFKSRRRLEAENLFLHHQLNIALRRAPPRLRLYGCPYRKPKRLTRTRVSVGLTQSLFRAGVNYQFSFFKTRNGSGRSSASFPLYRHLFALNSPDSARLTHKPRPKD